MKFQNLIASLFFCILSVVSCTETLEFRAGETTGSIPGILLLLQMSDEGVKVEGVITTELYFDIDEKMNEEFPFIYRIYKGEEVLYSDSMSQPVMVREFLNHYSPEIDLFALLPEIGQFYLIIPSIDGAEYLRFFIRYSDGSEEEVGELLFSELSSLEITPSDKVVSVETIYSSGVSSNRFDIAILGDGYTEEEMDKYRDDAEKVKEEILSRSPFSEYYNYLNIHRIDAISDESGASFDCDGRSGCEERFKENLFGSIFIIALVNSIMGTNYSDRAIIQLYQWEVARAASVVPFDSIMVIVNSDKYGGFAVYHASFTNGCSRFEEVGTHELGHSFGLLGDEYVSDECIEPKNFPLPPNISPWVSSKDEIKWSHWIEEGTPIPTPEKLDYRGIVGFFKGAYNCDEYYRPWLRCKMRTDYGDFCPVCREQLVRRLYRFVDPFDSDILSIRKKRGDLELSITPISSELYAEWFIDGFHEGILKADEPLTMEGDPLKGEHSIEVVLKDETEFVRLSDPHLSEGLQFSIGLE